MPSEQDAYASALFEVAKAQGSLDQVEEELFRVARAIEGNDELGWVLSDPALTLRQRQGVVQNLLEGRVSPVTVSLVAFVVGDGYSRDLSEIVDKLVARAAQERDELAGEVRTAYPLDDERVAGLTEALSRITGRRVQLRVVLDPEVRGGVIARVGDIVIDGSVGRRFEQLREQMQGSFEEASP